MKEIRMCIACRRRSNKQDFLRIVCDNESHPVLDETYKYNSRAVYICKNIECINKLKKMKDINKVVKLDVSKEEFSKLICELGENIF